jgi:hypothetical protein
LKYNFIDQPQSVRVLYKLRREADLLGRIKRLGGQSPGMAVTCPNASIVPVTVIPTVVTYHLDAVDQLPAY